MANRQDVITPYDIILQNTQEKDPSLCPVGPCDNPEYYNLWIAKNPMFCELFLRKVSIAPLSGHYNDLVIPSMMYLGVIGKAIYLRQKIDPSIMYTAMMGEMFGPMIPNNNILDQEESRRMIVNAVKSLISYENIESYTTGTRAGYHARIADEGNLHDEYLEAGTIEDWTDDENTSVPTPQAAVRILYYCACVANRAGLKNGLAVLAHTYVSIMKRGTVSTPFIRKIEKGIQDDLGKDIELMPEVISQFYKSFGTKIDADTIVILKNYWIAILPNEALRLSLTVQQAAGSGLTCLMTIGKALRSYQDFNWAEMNLLFPEEWVAFSAAVTEVNGNEWYGFNKDLGIVRSTKYKSLGWIAKELLYRVGGDNFIRSYGGWPSRIPHQGRVDVLISAYETRRSQAPTDDEIDEARPEGDALIRLVLERRNNTLFG